MNILHLAKYVKNSTGGVTTHIIALSKEQIKNGNKVIIASGGGEYEKEISENNIKHIKIKFNNPKNFFENYKHLKKLVKEERIDIIHCHWRVTCIYAKIVSMFIGVEFVWTNHLSNIPTDFRHRIFTFYGKQSIAVSSECKKILMENLKIPEKKITVVYNGIEAYKYKKINDKECLVLKNKYNIHNDDKVLTVLSRLDKCKGHSYLISAVGKFELSERLKYKLIFTGTGTEEYKNELLELAKNYKMEKNIVFAGYVNPIDILSITDIKVLPSKIEGFPIAIIESFMMRVPVIRTKTAGYLDTKDVCIGCEIGNIDELYGAIIKLNSSKVYRDKLVAKAYNWVNENATTEVMYKKIMEVYKK